MCGVFFSIPNFKILHQQADRNDVVQLCCKQFRTGSLFLNDIRRGEIPVQSSEYLYRKEPSRNFSVIIFFLPLRNGCTLVVSFGLCPPHPHITVPFVLEKRGRRIIVCLFVCIVRFFLFFFFFCFWRRAKLKRE